jgi:hypothetical protein
MKRMVRTETANKEEITTETRNGKAEGGRIPTGRDLVPDEEGGLRPQPKKRSPQRHRDTEKSTEKNT